ncbi:MAG: adenylyltransferase/cytidyltransferase family protein, partial [Nitrososphaerota archaeon]
MHKARRAVFIGRFQPFHLGHLEAVKQILQECNELIIAV